MDQSSQKPRPAAKLYDHIRELRMRLLVSVFSLIIAGVGVYFIYEPILNLLRAPLGETLYYNSPAGSFAVIMKICLMGALIITIPVIVYNIIMFIRPAFDKIISRKRIFLITGLSTFLAIAGAIFAYTCILPGTLSFFADFQFDGLNALISADNYLSFVTNMIIMFILVFQIPLLVAFIDSIKPLRPKKLLSIEKWVVLGSLVIALIAPFTYDLLTSLLSALPIIVLYNLSIIIVLVQHARIARTAGSVVVAKIIKPAQSNQISPEILLTDQVVDSFADELVILRKPMPLSTLSSGSSVMDIKRANVSPEKVEPAAWVEERKLRHAAFSNHVRVFSDFNNTPRTSHVLASQ